MSLHSIEKKDDLCPITLEPLGTATKVYFNEQGIGYDATALYDYMMYAKTLRDPLTRISMSLQNIHTIENIVSRKELSNHVYLCIVENARTELCDLAESRILLILDHCTQTRTSIKHASLSDRAILCVFYLTLRMFEKKKLLSPHVTPMFDDALLNIKKSYIETKNKTHYLEIRHALNESINYVKSTVLGFLKTNINTSVVVHEYDFGYGVEIDQDSVCNLVQQVIYV